MSHNVANDSSTQRVVPTARARRALIVADAAGLSLQQQLTTFGYVTRASSVADASTTIKEFEPNVVIMVVSHSDGDVENEDIALARRLRSETATYSLPIVFAWTEDERALRAAAQYTGADDYFPLSTPTAEILARLDSLFWRVETDRRSAPMMSDRRLEIDNFMFMLDAVREDLRAHATGTLALIYAVSSQGKDAAVDRAVRDRTLTEAHNFLKLNLRRVDGVAYYGPMTLLVYLPRLESQAAAAALSRLHREFREEHPDRDMVAGIASFPANGNDVERLIEKAEEAVNNARKAAGDKHVMAAEKRTQSATSPLSLESAPQTSSSRERETHANYIARISEPSSEVVREATIGAPGETPLTGISEHQSIRTNDPGPSTTDQRTDTASEAAARELERRTSGAVMPRRLLLTVSDPARMTQLNTLIRSAGYEARAAFNGQQALDLLRIEGQDLLLLDYELQGIDGVETIRRLRKQSGGRLSLPVVMLIASNNEGAQREALELGARSVLVSPYDPAELLASLRLAGRGE